MGYKFPERARAVSRLYYAAHRDAILQAAKRYRESCKEAIRARARARYRARSPERVQHERERRKAWREAKLRRIAAQRGNMPHSTDPASAVS